MVDPELLAELVISNTEYLRVYCYEYDAGTRLTISFETDDYIIQDEHFSPCYHPVTGKRNSFKEEDSLRLKEGVTLKKSPSKAFVQCCHLKEGSLVLKAGNQTITQPLLFDPHTGKKQLNLCKTGIV